MIAIVKLFKQIFCIGKNNSAGGGAIRKFFGGAGSGDSDNKKS